MVVTAHLTIYKADIGSSAAIRAIWRPLLAPASSRFRRWTAV